MAGTLKERLREELLEQARTGLPVTYKELADRLELSPPHTIHRITEALEQLMEEDVAAGRPLLAAFAVSKARPGIPARGFFLKARALGVCSGDLAEQEALDFSSIAAHEFHSRQQIARVEIAGVNDEACGALRRE